MTASSAGTNRPAANAGRKGRGWSGLGSPLLVALVALTVRVVYASAIVGPPSDDPAYYVTVARNLYAGNGFTSDVIWQYSLPFLTATHPAGEFWMPLASWLIYGAYLVAGVSWPAAQAPGVLAGSGLAVLTYAIGMRLFDGVGGQRVLATAAGLLVALNGVLAYQSVSADSSAPFSLLAAAALWTAGSKLDLDGTRVAPRGWRQVKWAALCGLLTALAYLARSDGIYLVFALSALAALGAWRQRRAAAVFGWWVPLLIAAGLMVAPWLARNLAVFGTAFPAPAARLMFLTRYEELFNFVVPPTLGQWWEQGLPSLLAVRGVALWHNWHDVLDFMFFPTVLLPVAGLVLWRGKQELAPFFWFSGLSLAGSALVFPVATLAGTFYHDAGALAPFLAAGAILALKVGVDRVAAVRHWGRDLFWLPYGALTVVVVAQLALTMGVTAAQHRAEARRLAVMAAWLAERPPETVICTEPYNLSYLTGGQALMLPVGEGPEAVLALARRYGARYVVVTHQAGRYPAALATISQRCDIGGGSDFCLAMQFADGGIYSVR